MTGLMPPYAVVACFEMSEFAAEVVDAYDNLICCCPEWEQAQMIADALNGEL